MMYSYISSLWIASDRSFFSMLTQLNRVETQRLIPWWYQWFCPGRIGGFRMIPSWELTFSIKRLLLSWFSELPVWCSPLVIVFSMKGKVTTTYCMNDTFAIRFVALLTWDCMVEDRRPAAASWRNPLPVAATTSWHCFQCPGATMDKWMRFVCCWRSEAFFPLQGIISNCIQFLIKRITSIKCFLQLSLAIQYPPN